MYCTNCGKEIDDDVKFCPNCGAPVKHNNGEFPQNTSASTYNYGTQYTETHVKKPKKRRGIGCLTVIIIFLILGFIGSLSDSKSNEDSKVLDEEDLLKSENIYDISSWLSVYEQHGKKPLELRTDIIRQNIDCLDRQLIKTVVSVDKKWSTYIESHTVDQEESDSVYGIEIRFSDKNIVSSLDEGETIIALGILDSPYEKKAVLKEGHLEDVSEESVQVFKNQLDVTIDTQNNIVKDIRDQIAAADAARLQQVIDEYKAECETLNYNSVCRDPDDYKGKKTSIKGKVIQVIEAGIFGNAYRISVNNDIWYVSYSPKSGESRILEGDIVTVYGECKGITTYVAVLGNTVTIPSLSAKYMIIN